MASVAKVREARAGARRQALIDAARALFSKQGFHQTGMAELAAASGVKMGQIYRDFGSKDDIIAAICEEDISLLLSDVRLFDDSRAGSPEALRTWIDDYVDHQPRVDQCRMMTEIAAEAGRNPRVAQILVDLESRLLTSLDSTLNAVTNGRIDPIVRLRIVKIMFALNLGLMIQKAAQPGHDSTGILRPAMDLIFGELERLMRHE
ncbi:TetR/AcrR family transcriptional regulator [Brevundimonas sp. SL130]|uniref:TetR/AcrR family transcriptional regulator n=1 Tax=Brevundimonas sp. SL130 TaxID=2995143 RepID=UPI00226D39AA|nr:TetR/AcrR family transcriptional regulator [Brevundimonas sp. SL130]WAC59612.1 TetR/AcrR family transcriptional regulator [Brevundimonas sp. SL130]